MVVTDETGSYIEKYFLSKQVRFIAINNGYDTNVSGVTVKIFEWLSKGAGTSTIAHRLIVMNIPIPSIYKKKVDNIIKSNLNYTMNLNDEG